MELFKTIYVIFSIKLIEKLSIRHLINSFDVFVIKDFTVKTLLFIDYPLIIKIHNFFSDFSNKKHI